MVHGGSRLRAQIYSVSVRRKRGYTEGYIYGKRDKDFAYSVDYSIRLSFTQSFTPFPYNLVPAFPISIRPWGRGCPT